MGFRTCEYCGKPLETDDIRAKYCSAKCRVYASRARKRGDAFMAASIGPGEADAARQRKIRARISANEIANAVVTIHGCCSVLRAGADTGPEDMREACRYLSDGILQVMEKVGL